MAKSIKQEVDSWNPQRATIAKLRSRDFKVRYRALRNSSSAYVKKASVRGATYKKYNSRCDIYSATDHLEVDHIVSVYQCAKGMFPIEKLNALENLRLLCTTCNGGKSP